jgi:hypothetical protein
MQHGVTWGLVTSRRKYCAVVGLRGRSRGAETVGDLDTLLERAVADDAERPSRAKSAAEHGKLFTWSSGAADAEPGARRGAGNFGIPHAAGTLHRQCWSCFRGPLVFPPLGCMSGEPGT